MNKEKQIEEMAWNMCDVPKHPSITSCEKCNCHGKCHPMYYAARAYNAGYRKQSEDERFEAVDMFRNLLTNKFIELCNYNDYGKINLLLIGETIDRIYDDVVTKMKGGDRYERNREV